MPALLSGIVLEAHNGKTAPSGGTPEEEERRHPARGARILLEEGTTQEGMLKAAIAAFEHHVGCDRKGFHSMDHEPHLVSRIVAIADAYDALTATPGPTPPLAPPDALSRMLGNPGFDPLLLKVFVNALGIYPVGSLVELSTGEIAIVSGPPATQAWLDRPPVRIVKRAQGTLEPDAVVDLSAAPENQRIARALPPARWKR